MVDISEQDLPDGTTVEQLEHALRHSLERPALTVERVECTRITHTITAPSTASLTRVRVLARDNRAIELRLVAKGLQSALRGLPPFIPGVDRERIAAGIPWRLEWEIYTCDTAARMPPGLRLPRLYGFVEHAEDRLTLWLEDVDPIDASWTPEDLAQAATALGRLTVRRMGQRLRTQPPTSFLEHLVDNGLQHWAIPALRGETLWAHPAFQQPEVASLRVDLLTLADKITERFADLSAVPWTQTHGDPTPMNLLRPRADPATFILIDWGTATRGPMGWDLVPLVFGPAENGTAGPDDIGERMAIAIPAFEAGLAQEGASFGAGVVAASVRTCALLRYPLTSLPLGEALVGGPHRDDLNAYARRKAAFIRAVLTACR